MQYSMPRVTHPKARVRMIEKVSSTSYNRVENVSYVRARVILYNVLHLVSGTEELSVSELLNHDFPG